MTRRRKIWLGVAAAVLPLFLLGAAYQPVVVEGQSMMPTLKDHQMVLMERHLAGPLHRGDIVVIDWEGERMVKRAYALGGDPLEYVVAPNGVRILMATTSLQREKLQRFLRQHPIGFRTERYTVPAGTVFVLGDNERESGDSREFGPVPLDAVVGRVLPARQAVRRLPASLIASIPRAKARPSPAR